MKYSELKRLLRSNGCQVLRQGANHEIWFSPITGRRFQVSRHNTEDARRKTLGNILKQSGIEL